MEDNNSKPGDENTPRIPTKEERINEHTKEKVNEIEKWAALQIEWTHDLRNNPRYKPYFEKYSALSVQSFIESYVTRKEHWLRYGPSQKEQAEHKATRYKDSAYEKLWEIQQKKLFNLQCEWRAEKIQLPGIEICNDFMYWEHGIKKCPFLPQITPAEVELYGEYLMSDDFDNQGHYVEWQEYEDFKEEYNGDGDTISMPEWYMFYDSRNGTGILLSYPDVRGAKEKKYMNAAWGKRGEETEKDKKEHPEKYPVRDNRPYLNYYPYKESLEEFVKLFEDKKTQELFTIYETESNSDEELDIDIHSLVFELEEIDEKVPVRANADWRLALRDAIHRYQQKKIAEALPAAYEEYLMRINIGISHPAESDHESTYTEIRNNYKKAIIEGRIMMGEPADLNF